VNCLVIAPEEAVVVRVCKPRLVGMERKRQCYVKDDSVVGWYGVAPRGNRGCKSKRGCNSNLLADNEGSSPFPRGDAGIVSGRPDHRCADAIIPFTTACGGWRGTERDPCSLSIQELGFPISSDKIDGMGNHLFHGPGLFWLSPVHPKTE
jgi:hypothetical protein